MDRHLWWRHFRRSLAQSPFTSFLLAIFAGATTYFAIDTFYKRVTGQLVRVAWFQPLSAYRV
jgi:hypothetical protein